MFCLIPYVLSLTFMNCYCRLIKLKLSSLKVTHPLCHFIHFNLWYLSYFLVVSMDLQINGKRFYFQLLYFLKISYFVHWSLCKFFKCLKQKVYIDTFSYRINLKQVIFSPHNNICHTFQKHLLILQIDFCIESIFMRLFVGNWSKK